MKCVCLCSGCMPPCYIGVYQCGLWSIVWVCLCGEWRFVWGLEVCVRTGGLCSPGCGRVYVAEVRGGGLRRCWGLCVFVIKSLHRLWVFSVVVRLDRLNSGTTHTFHIFPCFTLQKCICCNST